MNKCPTCICDLEEYVSNDYPKEEYGLWCDDCKEDMSSQMIYNNKEKEVKCENIKRYEWYKRNANKK